MSSYKIISKYYKQKRVNYKVKKLWKHSWIDYIWTVSYSIWTSLSLSAKYKLKQCLSHRWLQKEHKNHMVLDVIFLCIDWLIKSFKYMQLEILISELNSADLQSRKQIEDNLIWESQWQEWHHYKEGHPFQEGQWSYCVPGSKELNILTSFTEDWWKDGLLVCSLVQVIPWSSHQHYNTEKWKHICVSSSLFLTSSQNSLHRWRNKLTLERSPISTLGRWKYSQLAINPHPSQFIGLIYSIVSSNS